MFTLERMSRRGRSRPSVSYDDYWITELVQMIHEHLTQTHAAVARVRPQKYYIAVRSRPTYPDDNTETIVTEAYGIFFFLMY